MKKIPMILLLMAPGATLAICYGGNTERRRYHCQLSD